MSQRFKNEVIICAAASETGWRIVSSNEAGIQFEEPKTFGKDYYLAGLFLAVFGIGLLIWLLGLVDYLYKKNRFVFIPNYKLDAENVSELVKVFKDRPKRGL